MKSLCRPLVVSFAVASVCFAQAPATDKDAAFSLPESVDFNRDIRTIFSQTCFACHGPDENARQADLRLDRREFAIAERDGIRPIVEGQPDESEIYRRIATADTGEQMPPEDFHIQLSPRDKAIIRRWIEQGAEYQTHWSFIPPKRPNVPVVEDRSWVANPIDNFVISSRENRFGKRASKPAGQADRATLIRRASLDLIGLPPTPEQVNAFVNDPDGDDKAYAKVVRQLLSSPRFGEHRARYWLDAARYADTSGYQYDRIRQQWVWRDWVIHALNSNMPFDQFTIHQMAGDLLPDADDQSRLATGFHRNHPITIEGGVIDEEYRTEYVMDRVVTTTTTWMGLTFLCARCHDHKYDPIGQDDFYSFFAFFNNVPERGLNGFSPKAKIESPLRGRQASAIEKQIRLLQSEYDSLLSEKWGSIAAKEQQLKERLKQQSESISINKLEALGGTKLIQQEDASIVASGANPAVQTYTIEFSLNNIAAEAIRVEALTHSQLVNGSTGRASNGNFVLSEVEAEVAGTLPDQYSPIKIVSAKADYQQRSYPVTAAIDGQKGQTGWAVDGNTRFKNSTAVFTFARPIPAGSKVRIRLMHTWGGAHSMGRFRLSIPFGSEIASSSKLYSIVNQPRDKRSKADSEILRNALVSRYGGPEFTAINTQLDRLRGQLNSAQAATPETMVLTEMPSPRTTYVLQRGEYDKPIKTRARTPNIPQALGGLAEGLPQNRLGLAKWMVSSDNPLTARVTVNRFWAQIFGTGLVKTVEDFGSQGEYPTHPDLLDWLAVEFAESGWNVKRLFELILTSRTYRQSSYQSNEIATSDPQNRFLWRGPRHRLDAEVIRDSALAVAGLLDPTIGGPSVYPYHPEGLWLEINNRPGYSRAYPHSERPADLYRRSMYTFWKRTVPPPSMASFDAPEREFCMVARSRTNTPLQAFVLLHDPQFVEAAVQLGQLMLQQSDATTAERLSFGFRRCFARDPAPHELKTLSTAVKFWSEQFRSNPEMATAVLSIGQTHPSGDSEPWQAAAYATVARIMLNLSEFITKG